MPSQLLLPLGDRDARTHELQMVALGLVALNADLCSVGSKCGFYPFVRCCWSDVLGLVGLCVRGGISVRD
jgi:hypothetical protein